MPNYATQINDPWTSVDMVLPVSFYDFDCFYSNNFSIHRHLERFSGGVSFNLFRIVKF